jgi:Leucine-rich repeat (LRR) protein
MLPFANLPNIRFLDLSYNSISRVEGLETLTKLQHLSLEANNISSAMGIRPLSMNKELTTLVLAGNPFSMTPQYKPMLLNTIPSLITLDGHMLPQRKKLALSAHKNGYVEQVT